MTKQALKQRFDQTIQKAVERIKQFDPDKIILYGSALRGDIDKDSDIDFLVVKTGVERIKPFERVYQVLQLLDEEAAYEPKVFSPKEIDERLARNDWYLEEAVKSGKVLYEKK